MAWSRGLATLGWGTSDQPSPRRPTMNIKAKLLCAFAASGFAAFAATAPAQALSTTECSAKYQAAKSANALNGQKWNDFRKAQCGADATPVAAPVAVPAPAPAPAVVAKPKAAPAPAPAPATAAAPAVPSGPAVFPIAVSPKYAQESAGKARMHSCLDQYNANKTTNGNGGLKWIMKGGGYYSECNT